MSGVALAKTEGVSEVGALWATEGTNENLGKLKIGNCELAIHDFCADAFVGEYFEE